MIIIGFAKTPANVAVIDSLKEPPGTATCFYPFFAKELL